MDQRNKISKPYEDINFDYRGRFHFKDRLLFYLFVNCIKNLAGSNQSERNALAALLFGFLFCLTVFLFAGSEAVKLVHRRKMGANEISNVRFAISSLAFIAISPVILSQAEYASKAPLWSGFGKSIYLTEWGISVTAGFFFLVGILFFIKGIYSKKFAKTHNIPASYTGESILFHSLKKKGFKKRRIRNLLEPMSFLLCGLLFLFFNPFFAIPFIICSICYWFLLIIESIFGLEKQRTDDMTTNINTKNTSVVIPIS